MAPHKGSELNNVSETWKENERKRQQGEDNDLSGAPGRADTVSNDLQQTIHEEAAEYDRANKEDRLLDGERATLRDEESRANE